MKRKTLIITIIVLFCFTSCSPEVLQGIGSFLGKTGVSVLGSEVSTAEMDTMLENIVSENPDDVVEMLFEAKESPKMSAQLEKFLDSSVKETEENITALKTSKAVAETTDALVGMVNYISNGDFSDIANLAGAIEQAANSFDGNNLSETLGQVPYIGAMIDDDMAQKIVENIGIFTAIASRAPEVEEKISSVVGNFAGILGDLANASSSINDGMPNEIGSATGRDMINGVLEQKLVNDVISCAFTAVEASSADTLIESFDVILADLESIALVNPGVSFDSIDTLVGQLTDIAGELI